jgi:hypothetical protein
LVGLGAVAVGRSCSCRRGFWSCCCRSVLDLLSVGLGAVAVGRYVSCRRSVLDLSFWSVLQLLVLEFEAGGLEVSVWRCRSWSCQSWSRGCRSFLSCQRWSVMLLLLIGLGAFVGRSWSYCFDRSVLELSALEPWSSVGLGAVSLGQCMRLSAILSNLKLQQLPLLPHQQQ